MCAVTQVHKQVLELATKNLPPTVKAVAAKLAQNAPTSKLIDCSKLDAYKVRGVGECEGCSASI